MAEILFFDGTLSEDEEMEIRYYLSKKWAIESIIDSDSDGFTDALEEAAGSSAIDDESRPIHLASSVSAQIGEESDLSYIEENLRVWLDSTNIDTQSNATVTDGDAISKWRDLLGMVIMPIIMIQAINQR